MKHLRNFNRINEGYSAYDSVWVVIKQGDTDISEIYLDKSEADSALVKRQEELKSFSELSKWKYVVVTLDVAIDMIKDAVRDEENFNRWYDGNN